MKKLAIFIWFFILNTPFVHALHGISEAELVARMDATYNLCEKRYSSMRGLALAVEEKTERNSPGAIEQTKRIRRTKEYAVALAEQKDDVSLESAELFESKCKQLMEFSK